MYIKPILLALLAAAALFLVTVLTKRATHAHEWQPHLSRLPEVTVTSDTFSIAPYRDWTYDEDTPTAQEWTSTGPHRFDSVAQVWFVVEPHPGLDIMAHTLVLFEFEDGDVIGLTIEARKQADEKFSPLLGIFNKFELIYQWASPRDLLTRRAVMMDRELQMYRLKMSAPEREAYLRGLVARTASIETRPRFYNTLSSNCTNELAKTGGLKWHPAFVFTGYSAAALHGQGRIATDDMRDFHFIKKDARIDGSTRTLRKLSNSDFFAALKEDRFVEP